MSTSRATVCPCHWSACSLNFRNFRSYSHYFQNFLGSYSVSSCVTCKHCLSTVEVNCSIIYVYLRGTLPLLHTKIFFTTLYWKNTFFLSPQLLNIPSNALIIPFPIVILELTSLSHVPVELKSDNKY